MIVVDASALVAIGDGEADAALHLAALSRVRVAVISPINYVEAGVVLMGRKRFAKQSEFANFVADLEVTIDAGTRAKPRSTHTSGMERATTLPG